MWEDREIRGGGEREFGYIIYQRSVQRIAAVSLHTDLQSLFQTKESFETHRFILQKQLNMRNTNN